MGVFSYNLRHEELYLALLVAKVSVGREGYMHEVAHACTVYDDARGREFAQWTSKVCYHIYSDKSDELFLFLASPAEEFAE